MATIRGYADSLRPACKYKREHGVQLLRSAYDPRLKWKLSQHDKGLCSVTTSWEDTARTKDSSLGPNISDMTLLFEDIKMPLFRLSNYEDKTGDVPLSRFNILVGNEHGDELCPISLEEYLSNISQYLTSETDRKAMEGVSLVAKDQRDANLIVSSQMALLPDMSELSDFSDEISTDVDFLVEIYNYAAYWDRRATVLIIVASPHGTSACLVPLNLTTRKLVFNKNGQSHTFVAKSTGTVVGTSSSSGQKTDAEKREDNACKLLVIQVPVIMESPPKSTLVEHSSSWSFNVGSADSFDFGSPKITKAAVGVGKDLKYPYRGLDGHKVKRDERYPIRVTIQNYVVVDQPDRLWDISFSTLDAIADTLNEDLSAAVRIGSLVTEHDTGRTTEAKDTAPEPTVGWTTAPKSNSCDIPQWFVDYWEDQASPLGVAGAYKVATVQLGEFGGLHASVGRELCEKYMAKYL